MDSERPLFIPVILGTVRAGRMSEHAARLVTGELDKRTTIQTELIDIAHIDFPVQKKVHSLAVDVNTHRVYAPEQEEAGRPVSRMLIFDAVK